MRSNPIPWGHPSTAVELWRQSTTLGVASIELSTERVCLRQSLWAALRSLFSGARKEERNHPDKCKSRSRTHNKAGDMHDSYIIYVIIHLDYIWYDIHHKGCISANKYSKFIKKRGISLIIETLPTNGTIPTKIGNYHEAPCLRRKRARRIMDIL